MARLVKWARDLHPIRERALRSKTETWARKDIEALFGVGPPPPRPSRKPSVAFRPWERRTSSTAVSLLAFLDEMIAADSVEAALQKRLLEADPVPQPKGAAGVAARRPPACHAPGPAWKCDT